MAGPSTGIRIALDVTDAAATAADDDDDVYDDYDDSGTAGDASAIRVLSSTPLSPALVAQRRTGATPKVPSLSGALHLADSDAIVRCGAGDDCDELVSLSSTTPAERSTSAAVRRWRPALLGPLPPGFLRLSNEVGARSLLGILYTHT